MILLNAVKYDWAEHVILQGKQTHSIRKRRKKMKLVCHWKRSPVGCITSPTNLQSGTRGCPSVITASGFKVATNFLMVCIRRESSHFAYFAVELINN